MNDPHEYKQLVAKYFQNVKWKGVGTATNNITGALGNAQFGEFEAAFEQRLGRLSKKYPNGQNRTQIEKALRDLANQNNWEGAHAELVAYDFLWPDTNWGGISLNQTIKASEALTGELGNQNANFDGFYDCFNTYFDIKTLSDKSKDILQGIIADAIKAARAAELSIIPEYPLDMDFTTLQNNRNALLQELKNAITSNPQSTVDSAIVGGLSYKLLRGSGILTAASTYDPYLHARNHHTLLFKHAKKFSKTNPSLIVFVVFPWFSEPLPALAGCREIFFRSLSRRFFCQYSKDSRTANEIYDKLPNTMSAHCATKHLSGALFIDDQSITAKDPSKQNVEAFAFLNPNANHKVCHTFTSYLSELGFKIDGFENDNY